MIGEMSGKLVPTNIHRYIILDIFRNQPIGQSVTKKQHTIDRNISSFIFRVKHSGFSIFIRPIAIKCSVIAGFTFFTAKI